MPDTFVKTKVLQQENQMQPLPSWNLQSDVGERMKKCPQNSIETTDQFQQLRPEALQRLNNNSLGISALIPQAIAVILFDFPRSLTVLVEKPPKPLLFKPCPRTPKIEALTAFRLEVNIKYAMAQSLERLKEPGTLLQEKLGHVLCSSSEPELLYWVFPPLLGLSSAVTEAAQ